VRAVFVDANDTLAAITEKLWRAGDPPLAIHRDPDVKPDELPVVLGDAEIAIIDHTSMPTPLAAQCRGLKVGASAWPRSPGIGAKTGGLRSSLAGILPDG
jgi:hypothetical protein